MCHQVNSSNERLESHLRPDDLARVAIPTSEDLSACIQEYRALATRIA